MQLAEKAPPRKRPKNDAQSALLRGLLSDLHGRPMVPTYATKRNRRYAYYETRKDLARPADPPATRFAQAQLERHLVVSLSELLEDEHALRRLSGIEEAAQLRTMFDRGRVLSAELAFGESRKAAIHALVASVTIQAERIEIELKPDALGVPSDNHWKWSILLPARKPFREAKLRIDAGDGQRQPDPKLIQLLINAHEAQQLMLANPSLSINQLASREGRCRKQLGKLLRLSWLSPRLVEAIADGDQPQSLTRSRLLETDLPIDWSEQEELLGFAR